MKRAKDKYMMNRNKKGGMPEVTRATYKSVKKYDRKQFSDFCQIIYGYGYEDGRASVPGVDIEAIYQAIDNTKGIGPKTSEKLKEAISPLFTKEDEQ